MKVVLQGTPGSGKTTALQRLVSSEPGFSFVPELLLPFGSATDDYFFANDLAKARRAATLPGVVLIDRDFTSTLAFVTARDGATAASVRKLRRATETALQTGALTTPDLFCLFHVPPQLSLIRQAAWNAAAWSDAAFVERVDSILGQIVAEYIPESIICHIDGTLPEAAVAAHIVDQIRRKTYEATHSS